MKTDVMEIKALYELYKQHPVITTDSRDCPKGSIFLALKGETFNGNKFALQALEKGCAYAIVDEESEELRVKNWLSSFTTILLSRLTTVCRPSRTLHVNIADVLTSLL